VSKLAFVLPAAIQNLVKFRKPLKKHNTDSNIRHENLIQSFTLCCLCRQHHAENLKTSHVLCNIKERVALMELIAKSLLCLLCFANSFHLLFTIQNCSTKNTIIKATTTLKCTTWELCEFLILHLKSTSVFPKLKRS
jgi:hypothetical protein